MPDIWSDLMRLRNLRITRGEIKRRMDVYLDYACMGVSTRTATRISGTGGSPICDYALARVELQRELDKISADAELLEARYKALRGCLNDYERKVCDGFYLRGKTWAELSDELRVSQPYLWRVHTGAVHKMKKT